VNVVVAWQLEPVRRAGRDVICGLRGDRRRTDEAQAGGVARRARKARHRRVIHRRTAFETWKVVKFDAA